MIIKIFGSLCIIGACFYIGNEMANSLKMRAVYLNSFALAVSMTKDYISSLNMPLCDIYESLSVHIKPLNSFFLQLFEDKSAPAVSWKNALKTVKYLNDSDRKIILSMAEVLGSCDLASQINSLDFCEKNINENLHDAKANIQSDAKMYRSLSLFTGIGIAVLLI